MNLGRNPLMLAKIAWNAVPAGDPRFNRIQDQSARVCITDFQTYLKYGSNDPDRACHFRFLIPGAGFEPAL